MYQYTLRGTSSKGKYKTCCTKIYIYFVFKFLKTPLHDLTPIKLLFLPRHFINFYIPLLYQKKKKEKNRIEYKNNNKVRSFTFYISPIASTKRIRFKNTVCKSQWQTGRGTSQAFSSPIRGGRSIVVALRFFRSFFQWCPPPSPSLEVYPRASGANPSCLRIHP